MDTLLTTKLFKPAPAAHSVPRPRLHELLENSLQGKLTLLSAPAGYGKTTLAAGWLAGKDNVAWLTLDAYDDEWPRFLRYLVAALQTADPQIGQSLPASHRETGTQIDPLAAITSLLNDCTHSGLPLILVLDELQLIQNGTIHEALRFWVEHSPPAVHTVMISRSDPAYPLARWQVRRQLMKLGAADLQFTVDEAAQFLRRTMGLDLTDTQIMQLATRTEGWIAGLQLAALSLQSAVNADRFIEEFSGVDRQLIDYLLEEVLGGQDADIRQFLLSTGLLNRFSAGLAEAVSGRRDSRQLLRALEKRNLFVIALDNQGEWYRFHPLFAAFLRNQAAVELDTKELHLRAAGWLQGQDLAHEAIDHWLAAGAYDQAINLLVGLVKDRDWRFQHAHSLIRWCAQMPRDMLNDAPALALNLGWAMLFTGNIAPLHEHVKRLVAGWTTANRSATDLGELRLLQAEVALSDSEIDEALALLATIDPQTDLATDEMRAGMRQLEGYAQRKQANVASAEAALSESIVLSEKTGNRSLWLYANADLAETYILAGRPAEAEQVYRRIKFGMDGAPYLIGLGYVNVGLSRVFLARYELDKALELVQRGLAQIRESSANPADEQYGLRTLALIEEARGDWEGVERIFGRLDKLSTVHDQAQAALFEARLRARSGQDTSIWRTTLAGLRPAIKEPYLAAEWESVAARLALDDAPEAAVAALREVREEARDQSWGAMLLEIEVLLALALTRIGDKEAAIAVLSAALQTAEPQGTLYPFVIEGAPMTPLLRAVARANVVPAFIGRIQANFLPTQTTGQPLVDPLTRRELEILRLMAEGLSNREIAERLIIATGTVSKHSNNIFLKLSVRNRTEAVTRARQLDLL